jgi:hypothetical protein
MDAEEKAGALEAAPAQKGREAKAANARGPVSFMYPAQNPAGASGPPRRDTPPPRPQKPKKRAPGALKNRRGKFLRRAPRRTASRRNAWLASGAFPARAGRQTQNQKAPLAARRPPRLRSRPTPRGPRPLPRAAGRRRWPNAAPSA